MNKGCDKMRYGTCQFYKEHIAGKLYENGYGPNKQTYGPMEYKTYCTSFDNYERCPYYSYKNFNNQEIRDQYKKNQEDNAKGSLGALIIIGVILYFVLKHFGVF